MDKLTKFKSECSMCRGFCCRALFFFKSDGFPEDKAAGKNCRHLMKDYRCDIHEQLKERQLKGCLGYDCLGAGVKTTLFKADEKVLFDVFTIMEQLHEILWYLFIGQEVVKNKELRHQLWLKYQMIEALSELPVSQILNLDLAHYRQLVAPLLQLTYQEVNLENKVTLLKAKKKMGRLDLMGRDLHSLNLQGQDFKGAFLIGANLSNCDLTGVNFLGSDVRDMNIRGSDLSASLFLTQGQINACHGDQLTKLPKYLERPKHW